MPAKGTNEKNSDLNLGDFSRGAAGLTPHERGAMAEAASVCLDERGHRPGTRLEVRGSFRRVYRLYWRQPSARVRDAWANEEEATEVGACGVALIAVRSLTGLIPQRRAMTGTGIDYWLGAGRRTKTDSPFAGLTRLEVSGIRRGTPAQVRARARRKRRQAARSEGMGPLIVAVADFCEPQLLVIQA